MVVDKVVMVVDALLEMVVMVDTSLGVVKVMDMLFEKVVVLLRW